MFTYQSHLAKTAQALRTNRLDVKDYVQDICKIIQENEPHIKALVPEDNIHQRLVKDADILSKKFPDPDKRPALYGVPVGIKDIINANGFETKAGTKIPSDLFQGKEASLVTKLKNAGAIILGKTVTTEFAYYEPGETRNPHNLAHTPGGSSSGSAAAVAGGFTPLAIGTQTIGSVIRPAAYCGIIGFKPSFDRISIDGVIPFSVSADHIGIFTQDIEGIDLAASVLCDRWNPSGKNNNKPVIGAVGGKYLKQADPEIIDFYESKINKLKKAGFKIKRIDPFKNIDEINSNHIKMNSAEFSEVHKDWFVKHENTYRKKTKELILKGQDISDKELTFSKKGRTKLRNQIEYFARSNNIDVWLSPATTGVAPKGMQTGSPLMNLPWTYSGLPAITIPAGKSKNYLPIGLQITGIFNQDEELIAFAKYIQDAI